MTLDEFMALPARQALLMPVGHINTERACFARFTDTDIILLSASDCCALPCIAALMLNPCLAATLASIHLPTTHQTSQYQTLKSQMGR